MKTSIDRKTGQVVGSNELSIHSERLYILGQVERLHVSTQTTWYPGLDEVESYLASLPHERFVAGVTALEGKYLILWKSGARIYIFCDRYSLWPIYCRLTTTSLELLDRILDGSNPLLIPQENALAFLLLGFVPGRRTLFDGIDQIMPGECLLLNTANGEISIETVCVYPSRDCEVNNPQTASQTFHALFREGLEKRIGAYSPNEKLLLPLSGGVDSRYVLGTALELVAASRIIAMTFGAPGSYDFEIGQKVAKAMGVRHLAYPLSPAVYSAGALIKNCQDTDGQISFTTEAPVEVYQDLAQYGTVMLSGYVGDAVMGKKAHFKSNMVDHRSIVLDDITLKCSDPLAAYLPSNVVDASFYYENGQASSLDPAELWFFINHFTKYSFYCVFKLREHFKYINPFIDYAFLDYFLNLPLAMRAERKIYFEWLPRHFPQLSGLPCSSFWGAPLSAPPIEKWLAHQWDRLMHYGLGIDRRVNKINLYRSCRQLTNPEELYREMVDFLPAELLKQISKKSLYYFVLYNLKCLSILHSNLGIKLG
jgi:hypothetical protein